MTAGQHPGPHPRPGSAVQGSRDTLDSGHRTIMNTSQLSDKTGEEWEQYNMLLVIPGLLKFICPSSIYSCILYRQLRTWSYIIPAEASYLPVLPGSTLSVSASIHSTLSAGTLTDLENFAASNLNIQKKGLFRKKMSLKDVLSWQEEAIR